jgi:glutamate-1-semialdehyde 2,1-aminomutase
MRKLVYSTSLSLDGYIDSVAGDPSWVVPDEELHRHFNDVEREIDTLLYGRRMYELMAGYWPTADQDPSAPGVIVEYAQIWKPVPKVVFSSTLERVDWNSRLIRGDAVAEVARLKAQAGSGVATLGLPDSPGVPASTVADTLTAPYNDLAAVERLFAEFPGQIAGIIVEPVVGNMGLVPPVTGFLEGLRSVTANDGALLIFDEVMTGFRVHPGGAQTLYGVKPDLTTLGKVIGGGLPVGAYGGRREIMELVAPVGPMYQAGTLSGNPLAMVAGIETLKLLQEARAWEQLELAGQKLMEGLTLAAEDAGVTITAQRIGTMFGMFFTAGPVTNWSTAKQADTQKYAAFFRAMLENGVYLAPSQFEAGFLSTAHGAGEIEATIIAAAHSFAAVAG